MSLPIDRSAKATLDANLVNGILSDAPKLRASENVVYDTIDELNNKVDSLVGSSTLSPYPPAQYNKLINPTFEVWQGGSPINPSGAGVTYTADQWYVLTTLDGGTIPLMTASLLYDTNTGALTAPVFGSIPGTITAHRLFTSGAITAYGVNMQVNFSQKIENGARKLCGAGKKVSVSFWARSDKPNKRLGIWIVQNYGSGGTPTAQEGIAGTNITLTSTLTLYTVTFTTNTLNGKTFGTNNDDYLQLVFQHAWGANTRSLVGATTDENLIVNASVDIAEVQFNTGAQALPFQPRSFQEELLLCMRYFEKSFDYDTVPQNYTSYISGVSRAAIGVNTTATNAECLIPYRVEKRVVPTVSFYSAQSSTSAGKWSTFDTTDRLNLTPTANATKTKLGVNLLATGLTAGQGCEVHGNWTADARM